jgi:hypothetical protein
MGVLWVSIAEYSNIKNLQDVAGLSFIKSLVTIATSVTDKASTGTALRGIFGLDGRSRVCI